MTGNAVAVGKRLGVQPTLARRTAAAGRNGKRIVTGDPENANRVIGKGLRLDKIRAALAARKAAKAPMDLRHGHVDPLTPGGMKLPSKHPYLPGDASRGQLPPKSHVAEPRAYPKGISYRQPRLQGDVRGVGKAAPGTNGMGQLVPQFRGASLRSLTPQAPSFAPKAQGTKSPGLVAAGGTKASAPSTAGLSGVGTASGSGGTASGGGGTASGGGGSAGGVGKRRYDPEDERRHRQGAAAATSGIGGSALALAGAKDVRADTREARNARTVPAAALATLRPSKYPPSGPSGRVSRTLKDGKGKAVPAAEQRLAETMAHDRNHALWQQKHNAWEELARAPKSSLRGAVLSRRAAGKLGGGVALLGLGATLHGHRREPRYD